MRLEVIHGLDFSVGRNQAPNLALFDQGGAHRNSLIAAGYESRQQPDGCKNGEHRCRPAPGLRTVSIQWHAEKSARFNLSLDRHNDARKVTFGTWLVRCGERRFSLKFGAWIGVPGHRDYACDHDP